MKCGPDDCPIVAFSDLTPAEQRVERKRIATKMYDQSFTMEQIAKQLGVSFSTIKNDLVDLAENAKSKHAKTANNPKGSGRPKGKRSAPKPHPKRDAIVARADQGLSDKAIAAETGVPKDTVRREVEREQIEREAAAQIDPSTLSLSAQQKLDAAIRQHQRKLDMQFEQRVLDEIKKRMDEIILPHWRTQIAEAKKLYERRKHLMDKTTFNKIRRGLHPDSRQSISDRVLGEAFDTFMSLEKYLLNEADSPTEWPDIPSSAAEWDKMRTKPRRPNGAANIRPR